MNSVSSAERVSTPEECSRCGADLFRNAGDDLSRGICRVCVTTPAKREQPKRTPAAQHAGTPSATGRLLTMKQACAVVGVSRRTLYNWIEARKVAIVRTAGGNIRIYEDSLYRPGTQA